MTVVRLDPFDHNNLEAQLRLSGSNLSEIILLDHLGGFDSNLHNDFLCKVNNFASNIDQNLKVRTSYFFDQRIKKKYHCLSFVTDPFVGWTHFKKYNEHPALDYKYFLCSFNGSAHISRKLLVAILNKFGWFSTETCSKNFSFTPDQIDGHLQDLVSNSLFYRKFFISEESSEFFSNINNFGCERYRHWKNIHNLETQLTSSFLHVVSETMATSYYPFITEKFFYSLVTRGLFLAYAQPGWHACVERYLGFRKYDKIFDYRFDEIQNPVERLVEMMSMISKFSILSDNDWRDLYEMEKESIEFNYDHYFSDGYVKALEANAQ